VAHVAAFFSLQAAEAERDDDGVGVFSFLPLRKGLVTKTRARRLRVEVGEEEHVRRRKIKMG
jgi:hypothetical protein